MYLRGTILAAGLSLSAAFALAQDAITVGMQLEPPNLDPTAGAAQAIDSVVYGNIFEGLTRFQSDGSIKPLLAESWEISDDGTEYTFNLAQGVTFHDGSPMTAADVKFSLDRARAEDSTNAQKALFTGISDVEVVDDHTVKVTLSGPIGGFLTNMAWGDAVIVSEATVGNAATQPVGTGPYKLDRWVQGDRVELVRNDDYWGDAPVLERGTFKFISDPTAAFAAVMAGDVDAFPAYPAPETLPQFDADPRFKLIVGSTEGETILSMNNKSEPLSDVRVRKAIAHAINRQEIIDGAMFGFGIPIGSHFPPHSVDYKDLTDLSAYDPALSRELLAEAGYGDGLTLSLKLPPPAYARRGGEIIASQLRDVGVTTQIENLEWAQWLEQVFRGKDFDLTIVSHTEPNDINIYARPDYYFQYDNPEFQELIARIDVTSDDLERSELLREAQTIIAEDYVNGFLFQLAQTGVAKNEVEGIWSDAPAAAFLLDEISWSN